MSMGFDKKTAMLPVIPATPRLFLKKKAHTISCRSDRFQRKHKAGLRCRAFETCRTPCGLPFNTPPDC
jgi:hypothetical protein